MSCSNKLQMDSFRGGHLLNAKINLGRGEVGLIIPSIPKYIIEEWSMCGNILQWFKFLDLSAGGGAHTCK